MTLEQMKAMKLHEVQNIDSERSVLRVPNGWVYTQYSHTTYTTDGDYNNIYLPPVFVPEKEK